MIDLTDIERLSLHTLTLLLINLPQLQVSPSHKNNSQKQSPTAHGSDLGPQPLARGALADAQDWDGEQVSFKVSYEYIMIGMVALHIIHFTNMNCLNFDLFSTLNLKLRGYNGRGPSQCNPESIEVQYYLF